ncbi:MAG: acyl-CoA dehydrogenase family protein [Acidimicrobiales bacterium]|jgi:alkylation response protein AidB-like acyl-CoA dehydrogenase|nr:acyl-CoA dehydrogenase family protein [Acidimicrobiales bacterium]
MDFAWPDELLALRAEAEGVAREWAGRTDRGSTPDPMGTDFAVPEDSWLIGASRAFSLELARREWIGMTWPVEDGGHGRTALERFVVYEALIAGGAPIATSWFADRQIGPTLLQYGSPDQRRRFLPEILQGRSAWSIGMSEPDAGSDVASITTRAVRHGDEWIVDGAKVWNSGAAHADWCYLIARTDPTAPPHRGLSEFLVDLHGPGVEIRPIVDATGNAHFCELRFDGVRVPAENLVGVENDSFRQVMRQMEHERGGIDRLVSNRALYDAVLPRADTDDPRVRQRVAHLESMYRIGRLLVLREALGQAPAGFSAATKTICTEFEQEVAGFCAAVVGPEALLWNRVSRNACYAPAYTIMGGTTEILRNIVGDRILALPR